MAVPVIMPRQGQSVESCIIGEWYKKKGDMVNIGDLLFSYETDKAAFDEEAKVSGMLLEIFADEGDDVPVLTNVCVIGNPDEDISSFGLVKETEGNEILAAGEHQEKVAQEISTELTVPDDIIYDSEHIRISPRASKLAEKTGVDYRYAKGSGPYGRIIERDIEELREKGILVTAAAREHVADKPFEGSGLGGRITTCDIFKAHSAPETVISQNEAAASSEAEYVEEKLPNIRKVIAKAMYQSISTTAQLTLNTSFDASDILEFRKKIKNSMERLGLDNITLNDMIVYAVSRTLTKYKDLNAHFLDDKMRYFKNAHIGVAVDTDRGLMVPTIFNSNLKSLNDISSEIKQLVSECQKGTVNPDLLKGGTFTITNLGTLDIESFTPVLNPPQTGILGVNNIIQRVREEKGEYVYYPAMGLSLTFDHRALDGAPAAKFLKDLKINLESFSALLVK